MIKPTLITSSCSQTFKDGDFDFKPEEITNGKEKRNTLMIKNIPNKYTLENLLNEIDDLGFKNKYMFVYLPPDLDVSVYLMI